ncbi:hypothetical protein KR054_000290, partial [Drosophila jambulina]
ATEKMSAGTQTAPLSSARRNTQLENARAAIARGLVSVAITACNGVVIAADSTPPSPLYEVHSVRRVEMIDKHIGMVYSGIDPDYRALVNAARKLAQLHYISHMELIPVTELVKLVAKIMEDQTNLCSIRPYGVSLLACGWSNGCPLLYKVDPSGLYSAWKAAAQGKNAEHNNKVLVERYSEVLDIEDAIYIALHALWQGGCEMLPDNIEIGICSQKGFGRLDLGLLQEYLYCFA